MLTCTHILSLKLIAVEGLAPGEGCVPSSEGGYFLVLKVKVEMEFMAQGKHISTSPVNQESNHKRVLPTNLEWAGMWWIRSPDLADLKAKSLPLCVFSPFAAIFLCFSLVIEVNLVVVSFKCHFLPPQFRKSFETLVVLLLLWFSLFGHRRQPETVVKYGQLFEDACSAQLQFINKSRSCKFNYGALSGKSILRSDFLMRKCFSWWK